jgi:hypothetical protein
MEGVQETLEGNLVTFVVELADGSVQKRSFSWPALVGDALRDLTRGGDDTEQWSLEISGLPGHALQPQLPLRRVNLLQLCRQVFGLPQLRVVRAVGGEVPPLSAALKGVVTFEYELGRLVPALATEIAGWLADREVALFRARRAAERRVAGPEQGAPLWPCKYTDSVPPPPSLPVCTLPFVALWLIVSQSRPFSRSFLCGFSCHRSLS